MRWVAATGLILLLGFAIWYFKGSSNTPDSTQANDASSLGSSAARLEKNAGNEGPSREDQKLTAFMSDIEPPDFSVEILDELPPLGNSWRETYDALIESVQRGDAEAQFQLATVSRHCLKGPRTQEELDAYVALAPASGMDARGHFIRAEDARAERRAQGQVILDFCADSQLNELRQFPQWLESAADSGNPRAMLNYGIGYPGDEELDSSEENDRIIIEDRTAKYVEYLKTASRNGSIDATMRLANIYREKGSLDDRKQAFAHLYAYAWYRYKYEGSDGSFKYLEKAGFEATQSDFFEAVEMGRQLLAAQNCCFKIPEM